MGQCIGRRNYRYFLGFVISVCCLALYVAAFSTMMVLRAARQAYAGGRKPPLIDLVEKVRLLPLRMPRQSRRRGGD